MIVAVFRRRLREGKTFEDFKLAWEADGASAVGFVAIEPDAVPAGTDRVAAQEQMRHDRIDEVIESTGAQGDVPAGHRARPDERPPRGGDRLGREPASRPAGRQLRACRVSSSARS